ncbi:MAG: hypothetical protein QQW96_11220 [Tychonema bourrellyi B0820]|nr:hypothetical protein [Tychonema bourrellyi B0820]
MGNGEWGIGHWALGIGHSLFVICYWLLVIGYLLLVTWFTCEFTQQYLVIEYRCSAFKLSSVGCVSIIRFSVSA